MKGDNVKSFRGLFRLLPWPSPKPLVIPSDFPNGYDGTVLFSQRPQPEVDNTTVFASFQVIRLGDGGDAHLMKHDGAEHGPGGEVHPGRKS